jgi:energy-coupling factor transporter ATP-binding protein EcfA2
MTVLSADSLDVTTSSGDALLSDVSFGIDPGETVLLCGGPGSGKTLLAKSLAGLLQRRADLSVDGTIHRDGEVGYVFQYPATQLVRRVVRLDIGFGLENRGVDPDEIRDRVSRIADRFDATHLLDRRVEELSAGETTTVALLGVLVTEPDILVLDEPLSTLDYPSTKQVLATLDRLREAGTAVLIAEHDPRDLLARCDRVVRLADGEIRDEGPPEAVVEALHAAGVKLPFRTQFAIETDRAPEGPVPLGPDPVSEEGP